MARALELARQGEGHVEPNPMVGSVVVSDSQIVGEGWHERFGGDHAEVNALRAAGDHASGATLYVTLEPCCHTGKTPPCTQAIIAAGIRRVVAAVTDPYPEVAGGGFAQLREAGIECEAGVLEAKARDLLAPYLKLTTTGRPWVIAKWAMTLDGKLATHQGRSQWISCEASREIVHKIRGRVDAIAVGAGTVRGDDPLLTARPPGPRTPVRIVLGDLPRGSQLAATAAEIPLVVVADGNDSNIDREWMEEIGAELFCTEVESQAKQVLCLLDELGKRKMTNLLVEGGARVLGQLFDLGAVDEVHAFVAPKIAGGSGAPSPVGGEGVEQMDQALRIFECKIEQVGTDAYLHGRIAPPEI